MPENDEYPIPAFCKPLMWPLVAFIRYCDSCNKQQHLYSFTATERVYCARCKSPLRAVMVMAQCETCGAGANVLTRRCTNGHVAAKNAYDGQDRYARRYRSAYCENCDLLVNDPASQALSCPVCGTQMKIYEGPGNLPPSSIVDEEDHFYDDEGYASGNPEET